MDEISKQLSESNDPAFAFDTDSVGNIGTSSDTNQIDNILHPAARAILERFRPILEMVGF